MPRKKTPIPSRDLRVIDALAIDGTVQQVDETPVVPDDNVQKKTGDQPRHFESGEEKNEFVNSLDGKGKRMLAILEDLIR